MDFITKNIAFVSKFFLNNDPEDMTVLDTTAYASTAESVGSPGDVVGYTHPAVATTQVEIVLDAYLPNGNIFHDGDNTFTTPDIDRDTSDNISGIVIQKDASENLLTGNYRIDYQMKVTDELVSVNMTRHENVTGKCRVTLFEDWTAWCANGTKFEIKNSPDAANDGIYTLDTATYSNGETVIYFNEAMAGADQLAPSGNLEITATQIYYKTKLFNYNYEASAGKIILTADCDKSELRSEDITDYSQYDNSAPVTRNHVLRYPIDLVPSQGDITSQNAIISINPIYTNVWTATIAPVVEITQTDDLIIQDTLDATESIDVQCDDQWCSMFSCLENIGNNYEKALANGNQSEIQRWEQSWDKIQGYHMLWRIARSCGNTEAAAKYTDLALIEANAQDCCTPIDLTPSEPSKLVQPITEGGVTTIYNELVNQWFSGDGTPSDVIHDNGDFYLNKGPSDTPGDVFLKSAGVWVLQMNIDGDDGVNGTNGNDGADGVNGDDGADGSDGSDGLRGSQIYDETGVPGDGIGSIGDYSIDSVSSYIYRKTQETTPPYWVLYSDPNGVDGVAALFISETRTTAIPAISGVLETLKSTTINAGTVAATDTLKITGLVTRSDDLNSTDVVSLVYGNLAFTFAFPLNTGSISIVAEITYRAGTVNRIVAIKTEATATANGGNDVSIIYPVSPSNVYQYIGQATTGHDPDTDNVSVALRVSTENGVSFNSDMLRVSLIKAT